MRLVTFRRGRGEPKPGALWQEHVLDLAGLAKDLAAQRGTVRRGRGGFPARCWRSSRAARRCWALAREAWEYGQRLVGQTAAEELAQRRLAYPLKRVRLLAPIPSPARNVFCLGRNYADHAAERGAAAPGASGVLHQAGHRGGGARRRRGAPRHHQGARLRGRADRGDRHRRARHPAGRGARARLRLHHHQRRDRAGPAEARPAVVQGQVARHLLPDGPGAGHRRRDPGPAGPRDLAAGERPGPPVEPRPPR